MSITIYKDELGIADLVRNRSINYYSKVGMVEDEQRITLASVYKAQAQELKDNLHLSYSDDLGALNLTDKSLFLTKSILATSNWNKNNDIFLPDELWKARHSIIHKPDNISHTSEIIGHTINSWAVDGLGDIITEGPPSFFHVLTTAVIYKEFGEIEQEERAKELIESIKRGEKYVSMEASFDDFDYGVLDGESVSVIKRSEGTAFLSQFLTIYGGEGSYNGRKIGRVLRGINFIGKGYVDDPANPHSIIIDHKDGEVPFNDYVDSDDLGVLNIQGSVPTGNNLENKMSEEILKKLNDIEVGIKTSLTNVEAQNKAAAELAESNKSKYEAEVEKLKVELQTSVASSDSLNTKIVELEGKVADLEKALAEKSEEAAGYQSSIAQAQAEKVVAERISNLVSQGVDKALATELVEKFAGLTEEQFEFSAKLAVENVKIKASATDPDPDTCPPDDEDCLDGLEIEGKPVPNVIKASAEDNTELSKHYTNLLIKKNK